MPKPPINAFICAALTLFTVGGIEIPPATQPVWHPLGRFEADVDPEVYFGPRGEVVVTVGTDVLRCWTTFNQRPRSSPFPGEHNVVFSRDGGSFLTVDETRARLRDAKDGRLLQSFPNRGEVAGAISPAGTRVATATSDGLAVWDAACGSRINLISVPHDIDGVMFGEDGSRVFVSEREGLRQQTYRLLEVASGKDVFTPIRPEWEDIAGPPLDPRPWALSQDCRRLAVCTPYRFIVYDAKIGKLLYEKTPGGMIEKVEFSSDGARLLVATESAVFVFGTSDGKPVFPELQVAPEQGLAVSPDLTSIACRYKAFRNGRFEDSEHVGVWNIGTGKLVLDLDAERPEAFAFGPDGKELAVVSRDGRAALFGLR